MKPDRSSAGNENADRSSASGYRLPTDSSRWERLLAEAGQIRGVSLWQDARRRLRRQRVATIAGYFLLAIMVLSLLTPLLPLQSPVVQNLESRKFAPPSLTPVSLGIVGAGSTVELERSLRENWHNPGRLSRALLRIRLALFGDWCIPSICGTDELGRDLLARVMWGSRVSLSVACVAGLVSLLIGVSYGATAGYLGGKTDEIMMRLVDVLYSIPFIYVVIFLMTFLSEDRIKRLLEQQLGINRIMLLYLVIGAIYWLTMARVVRGQVISLKHEQFVEAARAIGASRTRIIFRHLVPNVMAVVIVYLTLTIPAVMLFESFLSFVGLGVQPPDVSWGQLMDAGIQAITPIRTYWWLVVFPGLTMTLTLFALNFFGDGLRDALDPRMKNRM